jgi:hypothetical protein
MSHATPDATRNSIREFSHAAAPRGRYGLRPCRAPVLVGLLLLVSVGAVGAGPAAGQDDPPALNPFAPRPRTRDDAQPGCATLSDGSRLPGRFFLTDDVRLKIYDEQLERQREIPLRVVQSIECKVKKQWMEKEWRFKENASDEKVYTGRAYPAREYVHTITLQDGRKISGPMSGLVYIEPYEGGSKKKLLMHKRQSGPIETSLDELVYLARVDLGEQALRDGLERKAAESADAP